jgi:hypothetical protein
MSYTGRVERGVVVFDGPNRPPDGAVVRVEETATPPEPSWGEVFRDLIGTAEGLPEDMAENHDHYIHGGPALAPVQPMLVDITRYG